MIYNRAFAYFRTERHIVLKNRTLRNIICRSLLDEGKIYLDGIGTILAKHLPAVQDKRQGTISPPKVDLSFTKRAYVKSSLRGKVNAIKGRKPIKSLDTFLKSIASGIEKKGSYHLQGIGTLQKRGKRVVLIEDDNVLVNEYFGLPTVKVKSIPQSKKAKKAAIEKILKEKATIVIKKPQAPTKLTPKPKVVSPVIKIEEKKEKVVLPQKPPEVKKIESTKITPVETTTLSTVTTSVSSVETLKESSSPATDTPIYNYDDDRSGFSDCLLPLLVGLVFLAAVIFGIWTCNNNQSTGPDDPLVVHEDDPASVEEPFLEESEKGKIDDVFDEDDQVVTFFDSESKEYFRQDQCTIVLGTFRRHKNALRMMDSVTQKGYDLYSEVIDGGLTRVGFSFDCYNEDLPSYIQGIRSTIEAKAWYLSPEITIDY